MILRSWIRKLFGRNARSFALRPRPRPHLEVLEDRTAPAVLTVTTTADNTFTDSLLSLREAVTLVNAAGDASAGLGRSLTAAEAAQVSGEFGSADTIQFTSGLTEPITLQQGQFVIARAVSITGPAAGLTLDAGSRNPFIDASRIFTVDDGTNTAIAVTLSGLTLTGGVADAGGAIINAEDLSLIGCTVAGNWAFLSGGGAIVNFGTLTLTDCTLSDNSAGGDGGGIANLGTATLTGCSISRNSATAFNGLGGGIYNKGSATLTDCPLSENSAGLDGGGIYNLGTATLANCAFTVNSANGGGGGIENNAAAMLTLNDCTFGGNSASFGGGIDNFGMATLTNCILLGNSAASGGLDSPFGGGGIVNAGTATLIHCTLSGNWSHTGGGLFNVGTATLADCTLADNSARIGERGIITAPAGGGLYNEGTATLSHCTLSGNSSINASGIANHGTTTLSDCTLAGNTGLGEYSGIGIANTGMLALTNSALTGTSGDGIVNGGTATITGCTLSDNSGVGLWNWGTATATLAACTLAGNTGGGIANVGTATIIDCTLSGNTNPLNGKGGGIANGGTATLIGCTLSGNSAVEGGGIYNNATITLYNSIVANSPAGGDVFNARVALGGDIFGTLAGSHNLIETPVAGEGTNLLIDTLTGDPLLGPLADNGGPTLTHALLPGSPALNQGSNAFAMDTSGNPLTTDQRGAPFVRIADGTVDLGAYEAQSFSLVVDTTADEDDGDYGPGDMSLREAVALASVNPGGDMITFHPTVFATPQTISLALGELSISDALSITGPAVGLTLDAGGTSRIFTVYDGTSAAIAVALSGLTLTGGRANAGGAIVNSEDLSLTGCTLVVNLATSNNGGGIYNIGTATLTGCTLSGNSAFNVGGGIFNDGTATLTDCTLAHNSVNRFGGGIANAGTATLTGCTLAGNSAVYAGGGMINMDTATLIGCTFSGNSAADGGGIYNGHTPRFEAIAITNCTLSGNSAVEGGGIFNASVATLNNSIVANSLAGGDVFNDRWDQEGYIDVGTLAGKHNLMETPVTGTGTNSLTDTLSGDPLLGPLQDNGGSTLTHTLLPGSTALNAGSNALAVDAAGNPLTTDQRGVPFVRISGGIVDLGAVEVKLPTVTIDQAAGQPDPTSAAPIHFTVVFSETVSNFTSGDVSLGGTAGATTALVTETGPLDGTTYDVAVTGMSSGGTVIASIAAGVTTNPAGYANTASTSTDNTVTVPYAPSITVPGAQTANEDVDLTVTGISMTDQDSTHLTVTLQVSHGTLTLGTTAGLTVTGNGRGAVTMSGNMMDLNSALASLNYRGNLNYSGTDTLGITASDGSLSASGSVTITVKSAAQQATELQAQVNALQAAGALNQGQANSVLVKLNLKNDYGDIGRVLAFLNEVDALLSAGILSPEQVSPLLGAGNVLLTGVRRR